MADDLNDIQPIHDGEDYEKEVRLRRQHRQGWREEDHQLISST